MLCYDNQKVIYVIMGEKVTEDTKTLSISGKGLITKFMEDSKHGITYCNNSK